MNKKSILLFIALSIFSSKLLADNNCAAISVLSLLETLEEDVSSLREFKKNRERAYYTSVDGSKLFEVLVLKNQSELVAYESLVSNINRSKPDQKNIDLNTLASTTFNDDKLSNKAKQVFCWAAMGCVGVTELAVLGATGYGISQLPPEAIKQLINLMSETIQIQDENGNTQEVPIGVFIGTGAAATASAPFIAIRKKMDVLRRKYFLFRDTGDARTPENSYEIEKQVNRISSRDFSGPVVVTLAVVKGVDSEMLHTLQNKNGFFRTTGEKFNQHLKENREVKTLTTEKHFVAYGKKSLFNEVVKFESKDLVVERITGEENDTSQLFGLSFLNNIGEVQKFSKSNRVYLIKQKLPGDIIGQAVLGYVVVKHGSIRSTLDFNLVSEFSTVSGEARLEQEDVKSQIKTSLFRNK